jgi:dihydroorotate dehydrogenase electron transfer subunit
MSQKVIAKVLSNDEVTPGTFKMFLDAPSVVEKAEPGQFVHIRVSSGTSSDPFLRRPLSIFSLDLDKGRLGLLFRVVGKGTSILAGMKDGDHLDIIGPLGRGFEIRENLKKIAIIGGGIGVAPLLELADRATKKGIEVHTLIGARTASMVLCSDEFRSWSTTLEIATDDGSMGKRSLVTDLLSEFLEREKVDGLFACGPVQMLKTVAKMARSSDLPCQVSLEARMACGIGACLGCTIKTQRDGKYLKVCKDGPVFKFS